MANFRSSRVVVRNASRALKIGVHLPFGPKFDVANRTFYPENFRLAYCAAVGSIFAFNFGSRLCTVSVIANLWTDLEWPLHITNLTQSFN